MVYVDWGSNKVQAQLSEVMLPICAAVFTVIYTRRGF